MTENEFLVSTDPVAMLENLRTDTSGRPTYISTLSDRKASLWAAACWRMIEPHSGVQEGRAVDVEAGIRDWREMVADMTPDDDCSGSHRRQCQQLSPTWAVLLRCVVGNPWRPYKRFGSVAVCDHTMKELFEITPTVVNLARVCYEDRCPAATMLALADSLEEAGLEGEDCETCRGYGVRWYCKLCRGLWVGAVSGGCPECGWKMQEATPTSRQNCPDCGGAGELPHPVLAHLRGSGPFCRGDWVLDLLLGKS